VMQSKATMTESTENSHALIGGRIREDRKRKGLTLLNVAEAVGLSPSYLSQIENGKVNINISNLEAIGKALGTPIADYILDTTTPAISVVRMKERHWYDRGDRIRESLLLKSPGSLEVAVIHLEVGANSGHSSSHPGEEFSYVSRGSVRITINDTQTFDLSEGDVIYYRSDQSHGWENIGDMTAHVLIVNTPASY
jgi:transcriptional regulator with XRE-family HTH domain